MTGQFITGQFILYIFDKVFRGVYQDEIEHFDVKDIIKEYRESLTKFRDQYRQFSRCGFTKEAEDYCKENGIACSHDVRWLE